MNPTDLMFIIVSERTYRYITCMHNIIDRIHTYIYIYTSYMFV